MTISKRLVSSIILLRICIGIVYLWFGTLKFFSGVSPAESIANETILHLTFGLIPPPASLLLLAIWETAIGITLISGYFSKQVFWFVIVHMVCTFTPLFLMPDISFTQAPIALTLVGQYIIKNIVIVSALIVIRRSEEE